MVWRDYWWLVLFLILALPLASIAAFAWWLRRQSNIDTDKAVKCWEVFIKLVSALTVVVSGAMLFGKYIDQQEMAQTEKAEREKHEIELRKADFLQRKLQFDSDRHQKKRTLFDEIRGLAARLALSDKPDKAALDRFEEMYFASLIGVEKPRGPVEAQMYQFRQKLLKREGASEASLKDLALKLSEACETELKESEEALIGQHKEISDLVTAIKTQ